jgi:hypothetical protein
MYDDCAVRAMFASVFDVMRFFEILFTGYRKGFIMEE